jgi:hypothetical protein
MSSKKKGMTKLSISMPTELAEWLKTESEENMRSVSAQIALLVKQYKESKEAKVSA